MFSTGAESEKFCEIAFLVLLREFFYGGTVAEIKTLCRGSKDASQSENCKK
jgi:hypothetical protein